MKRIIQTLKREDGAAALAWKNAHYSELGWQFDLEPRLRKLASPLLGEHEYSEHRYYVVSGAELKKRQFQVSAHTNRFYPSKPGDDSAGGVSTEDPASIVYSLHVNGGVAVLLYPHKSTWGTFGRDRPYIIGVYRNTNELAGAAGDAVIRGHIELFLQLLRMSMAVQTPNKSSERLLAKLENLSNRYSGIYGSQTEHRRVIIESELALGAGLAAGLVASTLFPMAQSIGKEKAESAGKIVQSCRQDYADKLNMYESCLRNSNHEVDSFIARAFSTEMLMIAAALVATFVVGVMWRRLKIR